MIFVLFPISFHTLHSDFQGEFEDVLLMCEVVGSDTPVLLALSANVRGLSVLYHLLQKPKHEE